MALDATELLCVNCVEEAHHEVTLARRRGRHIFGVLTTTGHDVVEQWGDRGVVDWRGRHKSFAAHEVARVEEFGRVVLGRGDEQRLFLVELDAVDLVLVRVDDVDAGVVVDNATVDEAEQLQLTGVGADHDATVERHPHARDSFGHVHNLDGSQGTDVLERLQIADTLGDLKEAELPDAGSGERFGKCEEHFVSLGEAHGVSGTGEGDVGEVLAGLAVVDDGSAVTRAGGDKRRVSRDVQIKDGAGVTVVRAESFTTIRQPHGGADILGSREEEVAVLVVLDDGQWPKVAVQKNRSHSERVEFYKSDEKTALRIFVVELQPNNKFWL